LAFYAAGTIDPLTIYAAPTDQAQDAKSPWQQVASSQDQISNIADNPLAVHGATLYLLVDKDAPNRKLITVDLDHPDMAHSKVLLAESNRVLLGVYAARDALYVSEKSGVKFDLRRISYEDSSKIDDISLPYDGTISGVDANVLVPGVVFALESWTQSPPMIQRPSA
jgi:prolyl oligopeptidase